MSLNDVRTDLATALDTITGLRIHTYIPYVIEELPAAIILPVTGQFNKNLPRSLISTKWEITILLARQGDVTESQDKLDDYIALSGTYSVKAAIEAGTYSTHASHICVIGWRNYGGIKYGEDVFIGVKFDIETI